MIKYGGKRSGKNNSCGCHRWEAIIKNRIGNNSGCPYCNNDITCVHNNLFVLHPELCKEWDYQNNLKSPHEYQAGSKTKVWWQAER